MPMFHKPPNAGVLAKTSVGDMMSTMAILMRPEVANLARLYMAN